MRSPAGEPILDGAGQIKLRLGDTEYRFHQDAFPLYPGERLISRVEKLPLVNENQALCLRAVTNFIDDNNLQRVAGQKWLFEGPGNFSFCFFYAEDLWRKGAVTL